jgi:hypothetical protein
MKGSIIRRGKRWAIILDVKDEHGGRRRKWHSGFRTRKEAETRCAELISANGARHLCRANKTHG